MNSLLIKNADYLVTMDKERRILRNASLYIKGPQIVEVDSQRKKADRIIDASGMLVLPGFINCHHHLFQSLFRNVPDLQNQRIDKWIAIMCVMTKEMDKETFYYAALTNMAELLLSGCTTTADFLYLFPKGRKGIFEAAIKAAQDIGIRFHPFRACLTLSKKDKALFDDDSERMIRKYHDRRKFSMTRIGLGTCTPFTNTKEDFITIGNLARKYKVNLQVHVAESEFENDYCLKKFGRRPVEYLHELGWQGSRVSYVHGIYLNLKEIEILANSQTALVHCPISNARGEGIAPITEMLAKGVKVGIGVDGSAGNDSSNILEEMRWARTLPGVRKGFTYLKPSEILEIGTLGGAKVLQRKDDLGSLEKGKAADVVIFDPEKEISHAGAVWDPVGSLIASQAIKPEYVVINGKIVVDYGKLITLKIAEIVKKQNQLARKIMKTVKTKL